jgi:XapX domain-containing protein
MTGYFVSLLVGVAVGVAYGLVQVRSPAPPLIALVGLLGILLGEQAVGLAEHHLAPLARTSIREVFTNLQTLPDRPRRQQSAASTEGSDV